MGGLTGFTLQQPHPRFCCGSYTHRSCSVRVNMRRVRDQQYNNVYFVCHYRLIVLKTTPRFFHISEFVPQNTTVISHGQYTSWRGRYSLLGHSFPLRQERCVSFEPEHDKTNKMICAPIEDSAHPRSLIRVFAVRFMGSQGQNVQADLSLRWAHMSFCWFCHAAADLHLNHCSSEP